MVQFVVSERVIRSVGCEDERVAFRPKRGGQIVKSIPPKRALVVCDNVVFEQVRLAIFQRRHQDVAPVGAVRHVQYLINLEQLPQVNFSGLEIHETQPRRTSKLGCECQGFSFWMPCEPRRMVVFHPGEPMSQHGMPCLFPGLHVQRANSKLAPFVCRKGPC